MSEQPTRATSVIAVLAAVLVAAVGGAAFVYGGADDSPGLQLIGVVLVVGALVSAARSVRAADRERRAR